MKSIPYFQQETEYTCGPACLRMVLASFGIVETEEQLSNLLGTEPKEGTKNKNFPKACEELKLQYIVNRNANIVDLRKTLKLGYRPIVAFINGEGHYGVVKKISPATIYIMDPYPNYGPDTAYNLKTFTKIWRNGFSDQEKRWFIGIKK